MVALMCVVQPMMLKKWCYPTKVSIFHLGFSNENIRGSSEFSVFFPLVFVWSSEFSRISKSFNVSFQLVSFQFQSLGPGFFPLVFIGKKGNSQKFHSSWFFSQQSEFWSRGSHENPRIPRWGPRCTERCCEHSETPNKRINMAE